MPITTNTSVSRSASPNIAAEAESCAPSSRRPVRALIRAGVIGGIVASIATMLVASIGRAADVSLDVDGKAIPLAGFATITLFGAAVGIVLAVVLNHRTRFVAVCSVLAAASLIPSITQPDHSSTKLLLIITHVVAAAIIVPLLARQLPPRVASR